MIKYDMIFVIWQGAVMKNFAKALYVTVCIAAVWLINAKLVHLGIDNWYAGFEKPAVTPPDIVFPIVWSILYLMLGAAFYLALKNGSREQASRANHIFLVQLFLQAIWAFLFFYKGQVGAALACIILLDFAVYKMLLAFKSTGRISAYLAAPYFLWLVYATLLNLNFVYAAGLIVNF